MHLCIPPGTVPSLLCDTRHGRRHWGHWGPRSKVPGMSLPPRGSAGFVPLSLSPCIFQSFASLSAASWLCAALMILHRWKCFWLGLGSEGPWVNAEPSCPCPTSSPLANSSQGTPGRAALYPSSPKLQKSAWSALRYVVSGLPRCLGRSGAGSIHVNVAPWGPAVLVPSCRGGLGMGPHVIPLDQGSVPRDGEEGKALHLSAIAPRCAPRTMGERPALARAEPQQCSVLG